MNEDVIVDYFKTKTEFKPKSISYIGGGASASVYKAEFETAPYTAAVKFSQYPQLLQREYEQIKFISDRVECRLPKLFFFGMDDNSNAYMLMEYFEGVSGNKIKNSRKVAEVLTDQITDNLLKIHSVHNDKFGPIDNAVYDTWYEYYSEFAKDIYAFAKESYNNGKIRKKVLQAVELSYKQLDKILEGSDGEPTLIHGDYWQPNFVVNPTTYDLVGILDPFNILWAEPEYELFALATGSGKKLKLYENYKSKINPTNLCDLKLEMYALYNELLWHKKLGTFNNGYLMFRSRRLIKQMKRNKLL